MLHAELASDDHEAWLRHLGVADVFSDGSGGESEGDRSHGRPSTGSDGGDSQGGSDSGSEGALEARRKKGVKRRVHSAAVPEEHAWRIAEEKRQSRGEHGGGRERREGREARAKPALPNRGTWAGIGGTREGEGERSGGRGATGPGERAGVPTGASRGMGADGGDTRAPGMAKGGEQGEKGGPSRAGPSKPASAGGVSGAKRAAGPEGRALGGAQRKKGKKGGRGVSGGAGELGAALASFLTSDAPNIGMTFTREEIRKVVEAMGHPHVTLPCSLCIVLGKMIGKMCAGTSRAIHEAPLCLQSKPWLWDKGPKGPKRKPLSLDE